MDLLKSQEIDLDYILALIFDKNKTMKSKDSLIDEIRRMIRSSVASRAKESFVVDFINQSNLDEIQDKASVIEAFYLFVQKEQVKEASQLIEEEQLNVEAAKRYILNSLKREFASDKGTEINETIPNYTPLKQECVIKKKNVLKRISEFVDKFKGVGGSV